MPKQKDGKENKVTRIVPTFTPTDRQRYIAMCEEKGIKYFSKHLHDVAIAEVEAFEASKA